MRLSETVRLAAEKNFDYFGSTLSISPHKKADKISELGNLLEKRWSVKFLNRDWKKLGGFKQACKISKHYKFYRQNYCGCIFSKNKNKKTARE